MASMEMTKAGRWTLCAVLLAFGLLCVWMASEIGPLEQATGPLPGDGAAEALREADAPTKDEGPTLASRAVVVPEQDAAADAPPPPDGTPAGPRWLRVLDERGRPVEDAGVDWLYAKHVTEPVIELGGQAIPYDPSKRTARDGRAPVPSWVRSVGGSCFRVRNPGYVTAKRPFPRGRATQELVVRLERLARMQGTVRDPAGHPWAGLRVHVKHAERGVLVEHTTDDAGAWDGPMLAGRVTITVKGEAGDIVTRSPVLESDRLFTWDVTAPAAGLICGTLEVEGAKPDERFDVWCRWPDAPGAESRRRGPAQQCLLLLRSGAPLRFQQPAGGRTAVLRVHQHASTLPLHVREGVAPGETALTLRVEARLHGTGTIRMTIDRKDRESPFNGVAELHGPEGTLATSWIRHRGATQKTPVVVTFRQVPIGPSFDLTIRPYRSRSMIEVESGRVFDDQPMPPIWSRTVRAVAGEVVELGAIDIGR